MSAYIELYSDYIDAIKSYNQDFSVTPISFMRNLSRGMQVFQRETEIMERVGEIGYVDGAFSLHDEIWRIIEVIDVNGVTLVSNDYRQFRRNIQTQSIQNNTPMFYNLRNTKEARLYTVYDRRIYIYPFIESVDEKLIVRFTYNLLPFSSTSVTNLWMDFFPLETNFDIGMASSFPIELVPYEGAILDYAIAIYLKSIGSPNFQVYEANFWNEVERAKLNKQMYASEAVADYNVSPYTPPAYE